MDESKESGLSEFVEDATGFINLLLKKERTEVQKALMRGKAESLFEKFDRLSGTEQLEVVRAIGKAGAILKIREVTELFKAMDDRISRTPSKFLHELLAFVNNKMDEKKLKAVEVAGALEVALKILTDTAAEEVYSGLDKELDINIHKGDEKE